MKTQHVHNPFDGSLLYSYEYESGTLVGQVLEKLDAGRAKAAALAPFERAEVLQKAARLTADSAQELARQITRETGKVIRDSHAEIARAVAVLECASVEARKLEGEILDADAYGPKARHKKAHVEWFPVGTILAITPFNFPINLAAHKIAPALAVGNCVLWKPAPMCRRSSEMWMELLHKAGVPEDQLAIAVPDIPDMAKVCADPRVHCVSFTGGTIGGKAVLAASGLKKVMLELGGHDPLIVMDDANLDAATDAVINQRFLSGGQRCTAAKRLFVHQDVLDNFRTLLLSKAENVVVGDPMDERTDVGPVIHAQAAQQVQEAIDDAVAKGAKILCGGTSSDAMVQPTILENIDDQALVAVEEVFGPVAPIFAFAQLEEVVAAVNSSQYGLQAGVFTNQLDTIQHLYANLQVGALAVNDGPGFRADHFPFGGVKQSGLGREGVAYAMRSMAQRKSLIY